MYRGKASGREALTAGRENKSQGSGQRKQEKSTYRVMDCGKADGRGSCTGVEEIVPRVGRTRTAGRVNGNSKVNISGHIPREGRGSRDMHHGSREGLPRVGRSGTDGRVNGNSKSQQLDCVLRDEEGPRIMYRGSRIPYPGSRIYVPRYGQRTVNGRSTISRKSQRFQIVKNWLPCGLRSSYEGLVES